MCLQSVNRYIIFLSAITYPILFNVHGFLDDRKLNFDNWKRMELRKRNRADCDQFQLEMYLPANRNFSQRRKRRRGLAWNSSRPSVNNYVNDRNTRRFYYGDPFPIKRLLWWWLWVLAYGIRRNTTWIVSSFSSHRVGQFFVNNYLRIFNLSLNICPERQISW